MTYLPRWLLIPFNLSWLKLGANNIFVSFPLFFPRKFPDYSESSDCLGLCLLAVCSMDTFGLVVFLGIFWEKFRAKVCRENILFGYLDAPFFFFLTLLFVVGSGLLWLFHFVGQHINYWAWPCIGRSTTRACYEIDGIGRIVGLLPYWRSWGFTVARSEVVLFTAEAYKVSSFPYAFFLNSLLMLFLFGDLVLSSSVVVLSSGSWLSIWFIFWFLVALCEWLHSFLMIWCMFTICNIFARF